MYSTFEVGKLRKVKIELMLKRLFEIRDKKFSLHHVITLLTVDSKIIRALEIIRLKNSYLMQFL